MQQTFDFHSHTTVSDGSLSPRQLVEKAFNEGIKTIAITDHDNIGGISDASKRGKELGIKVIPGVEISIDYSPGTMHMCGYNIDINNKELLNGLVFVQEARRNRNPEIIKKMNKLGIDINLDEVKSVAGSDQIGRPHFARILIEKGYAKDIKEAFEKYLAKGAPCYLDKKRLSLDKAIKMILNAKGLPVLAHPVQLGLKDEAEYREFFQEMKNKGVLGIEAYSSHQTDVENQMFFNLATELDMMVFGGSDFHGDTKPKVKLGVFGRNVKIDLSTLLKQLKRN